MLRFTPHVLADLSNVAASSHASGSKGKCQTFSTRTFFTKNFNLHNAKIKQNTDTM